MKKQPLFASYAIFQTGGKQYQAIVGKTVSIEKLEAEVGEKIQFDDVLLAKYDEDKVNIGQPFLSTPVMATVVKHLKGPKLVVFKFNRRKKSRVKRGHRQLATVVRIESF